MQARENGSGDLMALKYVVSFIFFFLLCSRLTPASSPGCSGSCTPRPARTAAKPVVSCRLCGSSPSSKVRNSSNLTKGGVPLLIYSLSFNSPRIPRFPLRPSQSYASHHWFLVPASGPSSHTADGRRAPHPCQDADDPGRLEAAVYRDVLEH